MRSIRLTAVLAAAFAFSAACQAQDAPPAIHLGLEIGASSVSSKVVESDNDPSLGVSLGYRVNPNFGVEVFGRSLSFRILDGLVGDDNYYPQGHQGIAALGYLPLNERFTAYARLGIGRTKMESASTNRPDFSETDPSVGAGVTWDFARNFAVKLEATRFTKSHVSTVTAGLLMRF